MPQWKQCHCQQPWEGRFMLRCDGCSAWIHGDCAGIKEDDAAQYDKFHCSMCLDIFGPSVLRPPPPLRPTRESRTLIDYNEMNKGGVEDERKFTKLLQTKRFIPAKFPHVSGDMLTLQWMRMTGMPDPIIVDDPEGLDMRMPPPNLTVDQVADACGRQKIVEAMEVSTQNDKQMTLDEWAQYFATPEDKRRKLLNVISLEISESMLNSQIVRPRIVRELDWIDNVWPPRHEVVEFPRVQLYCLMSVKDCYTDFHIDFGGSSVFYHILSGQKVFYFIRPTPVNLKKYEKWSSSPDQSRIFFGDEVKECYEVHLTAGNTMFIPSGWIHAVYTPCDSVVIGGNFLHGLRMDVQLEVYSIENKSGVPPKFRFPFFVRMQWYAAKKYLADLRRDPSVLSNHEIQGLQHIVNFLGTEIRKLTEPGFVERAEYRLAKGNIPPNVRNLQRLVLSLKAAVTRIMALRYGDASSSAPPPPLRPEEEWNSDESEREYDESDSEQGLDEDDEDELLGGVAEVGNDDGGGDDDKEGDDFVLDDADGEADGDQTIVNDDGQLLTRSKATGKKKRFRGVDGFVDDSGDVDYESFSSKSKHKKARKGDSEGHGSRSRSNGHRATTKPAAGADTGDGQQQERPQKEYMVTSNGIPYQPVPVPYSQPVYKPHSYIPMFPSAAASSAAALILAATSGGGASAAQTYATPTAGPSQSFSLRQGMQGPETTYHVAPKPNVFVPPPQAKAKVAAGGGAGAAGSGAGGKKKPPGVFARLAKKMGSLKSKSSY